VNALQGRLSEGALANLVQYLALNQASGCLQLVADAGMANGVSANAAAAAPEARGAIYLVAGRVEHVEAGALQGVPALSELLAWRSGRFAFVIGLLAPRRTLDLSVDALLLHASFGRDLAANGHGVNGAASATPAAGAVPPPGAPPGAPAGAPAAAATGTPTDPVVPSGVRTSSPGASRGGLLAGALTPTLSGARSAAPLFEPTPLADPALLPGLVWAAVAVAGPIGEIFVDEAFDTIGHTPRLLPESALGALVHEVAGRFRSSEGRAQFIARAEAVLAHHGYGRVEDPA